MSNKKTSQSGSSTQANTSTATTTPNVPDWIADPSKQIAGNIQGFLNQGPDAYTPQTSALQQQAFNTAGTLGAGSSQYLSQAGDALNSVGNISADQVTGQSLLTNLSDYYNPFKDQVLNPVLADYDVQSGQTRAAQAAAAAKNQAFQGSRYGIQEANTEDALARGRATTEGGLLNQMYTSATGLSGEDAARRQSAMTSNQSANLAAAQANQSAELQKAQQLAALGISTGSEDRANLGVQAGLGGILTDQQNAARQYPLTYQQQQESLLSGLDPSLYTGKTVDASGTQTGTSNSTTTQDPGLLSKLGQAAQIAALFA